MHAGIDVRRPLRLLCKPLYTALASGCLALSVQAPASAALSLTTERIFNFDFTNPAQPAGSEPPYDGVIFDLTFGGATGTISFKFYNDLDGLGGFTAGGPISVTVPPGSLETGSGSSGLFDGQFSVGLTSSTLLLDTFTAKGCKLGCLFETAPLAGTLVASVPEPATLALLGIAIAGLGVARRKRRN